MTHYSKVCSALSNMLRHCSSEEQQSGETRDQYNDHRTPPQIAIDTLTHIPTQNTHSLNCSSYVPRMSRESR